MLEFVRKLKPFRINKLALKRIIDKNRANGVLGREGKEAGLAVKNDR